MTAPYPHDLRGPCHFVIPAENSRKLAIFFGAKDLRPGQFNFFQIGQDLGCNVIFLNNGANHWYQYGIPGLGETFDSSMATLRAWIDALDVSEVFTFGSSMGSYGALQYGAPLHAQSLCFATDSVINAPLSSSARFFTGRSDLTYPDLHQILPQTKERIVLYAGERDVGDLQAAADLTRYDNITAITLIGANHFVPTYLSRQGRLMPMIRRFIRGGSMPDLPETGRALQAGSYVSETVNAKLALDNQNLEKALVHVEKALEDYPFGEAALVTKGIILSRTKDIDGAVAALQTAIALQPDDDETLQLLGALLRNAGQLPQARMLISRALNIAPRNARAHYSLGLIQQDEGYLDAALKSYQHAAKFDPKVRTYRDRVTITRKKILALKTK